MSHGLEACLVAARPKVIAALSRYFRDLDAAEDAFQEACLRALRSWPEKGRPRDEVGWLILVGRNAGIDEARRIGKLQGAANLGLDSAAGGEDEELTALEQRRFGDDVVHLLFLCCHPALAPSHQIALALRLVCGLTVPEIARAFLVAPRTMEQRLTRAKRRLAEAQVPFGTPTLAERRQRLGAVAAMVYLLFNEGYSASGGEIHLRLPLCTEAVRLARLLLRLWPSEPELMGLLALLILQHSRHGARLDTQGEIVLLEQQDRSLWHRPSIAEGLVLVEKALRHRRPGPYQVQAAIAAVHARARRAADTDWAEIETLYRALEELEPTPVMRLNRTVAVWKSDGARAALDLLDTLGDSLEGYFHFHGVRGALRLEAGVPGALRELRRALELARTPAERAHLSEKIEEISSDSSVDVGSGPASSS